MRQHTPFPPDCIKRYNKTLTLIVFQIITFLFSPSNVFAISNIERILKDEPLKFGFIILGICAVFVGVSLLLSYYKTTFRVARSLITGKNKTANPKIPTGKIVDISLPNAKLIVKERDGEI